MNCEIAGVVQRGRTVDNAGNFAIHSARFATFHRVAGATRIGAMYTTWCLKSEAELVRLCANGAPANRSTNADSSCGMVHRARDASLFECQGSLVRLGSGRARTLNGFHGRLLGLLRRRDRVRGHFQEVSAEDVKH